MEQTPERHTIPEWIKIRNMTQQHCADKVGLSLKTFLIKIGSPLELTIRQLYHICKVLKIEWDQIDFESPHKKAGTGLDTNLRTVADVLRKKMKES